MVAVMNTEYLILNCNLRGVVRAGLLNNYYGCDIHSLVPAATWSLGKVGAYVSPTIGAETYSLQWEEPSGL